MLFTTLWLLVAYSGLDELVMARVNLGSVAQQLELVYTTMALYREELDQKLEELIEIIGRELMEHSAELW